MSPALAGGEFLSALRQSVPGLWLSVLLLPVAFMLLPFIFGTASQRRHRRYQRQAVRILARLPQLRDDAARLVYLRKINPYVFEEMLLTAFARQGCRIKRNTRYSGDGGVDGQVWIDGRRWLIQAKRYSSCISSQYVLDFGALVRQERCRGFFVHTGRTGEVSREALRAVPDVSLISGNSLLKLLSGNAGWQYIDQ